MADIQFCDNSFNFRKDKETGLWGCVNEVVVGRSEHDICKDWRCAICQEPMIIHSFDGPEPKIYPVDHSTCWPT